MIRTDKVIVVEGKYDAIKLANFVEATIITTDGFGIFKNEEKQKLLLTLAEKRGLIILTDSDSAGFMIRNFIGNKVPKEYITDVYIPDIFGKEKRKAQPSAEGKLGVEGMPEKVLAEALKKFGEGKSESDERKITRMDFYEDGLMGGPDSKAKRQELLKKLELPSRLSTTKLLEIINILITYDEYRELIKE